MLFDKHSEGWYFSKARRCFYCCVKKYAKATIGSIGTLSTDLAIESALSMRNLCAQKSDRAV